MRTIRPTAEVSLGHRAYHVACSAAGYVLACTKEGETALIDPSMRLVGRGTIPRSEKYLTLSPYGELISVISDDGLHLCHWRGLVDVGQVKGSFLAASFTPQVGPLWTLSRADSENATLELRESSEWKVLGRALLEDPFGDSSFEILPHPRLPDIAIYAGAGQDGQAIFWARPDGTSIHVERFGEVESTKPPSFHPLGTEFLIIHDHDELWRCSYPQGDVLTRVRLQLPRAEGHPWDLAHFVGESHALCMNAEGRLLLVDLFNARMLEEVAILGHEPRPIRDLHPSYRGSIELASDLGYIHRLGPGRFASVHRDLPETHQGEWRDRILFWDEPVLE